MHLDGCDARPLAPHFIRVTRDETSRYSMQTRPTQRQLPGREARGLARAPGSLSPWPAALSSNARVWALSASRAQAFVAGSVAFDTESFAASAALEAVCDAPLYESSASESQSSTPEPERLLMMTATAAIMPPTISTPM